MDPLLVGYLVVGAVLLLLASRVPIGIALGLPAIVGLSVLVGRPLTGPRQAVSTVFEVFRQQGFAIIPLYLLLGSLAYHTGMVGKLFDAFERWVGGVKGGLAIATGLCAGLFAAITGSSVATVAAMAKTALPEMRRHHYSDRLAAGVIAGSGSVGILIPPSVILVVYGILAQQSIGRLLLAAIVPGALTVFANVATVSTLVRIWPDSAPERVRFSWKQKIEVIPEIGPIAAVFAVVIGGIYVGWFQPAESAAAGVVAVAAIALFRRSLTRNAVLTSLRESVILTSSLLLLLAGAFVLGNFLALSGLTRTVLDSITSSGLGPVAVLSLFIVVFVIMGMFLDGNTIMALTLPIVIPVIVALGYDPIWFGIIMVKVTEIAMDTPPVGLNVYTLAGAAPDIPLGTIFRGVIPFTLADVSIIALLIAIPELATWLPDLVF